MAVCCYHGPNDNGSPRPQKFMDREATKSTPAAADRATQRLNSWKEIAAYLGATDRTAQRWEREEGLPIHRLVHQNRATVYAYKQELEAWLDQRSSMGSVVSAVPAARADAPAANTASGRRVWALASVGMLLGATGLLFMLRDPAPLLPEPSYVELVLPAHTTRRSVALSPNGRRLAFVGTMGEDEPRKLWLRELGDGTITAVAGTEGATEPFWAPDNASLGYFARGRLFTVVPGGAPKPLAEAPEPSGGSWSDDGVIAFGAKYFSPLQAIAADGGELRDITPLPGDDRLTGYRRPVFLPGGERFLFCARREDRSTALMVGHLDGRPAQYVAEVDAQANYLSPGPGEDLGTLFYVRESTLWAQRFDVASAELEGEALRVGDEIETKFVSARASFTVAQNRTVLFLGRPNRPVPSRVWHLDRAGEPIATVPATAVHGGLVLSPDGSRLLLVGGGNVQVHVMDLGTERSTLLSSNIGNPIWSQDGSRIAFVELEDGEPVIRVTAADRLAAQPVRFADSARRRPRALTRDETLIYDQMGPGRNGDIWARPLDGGEPVPIAVTAHNERRARLSPDGRWLAYMSNETGQDEVYVQPFPPDGARWAVSVNGGRRPEWSRDSNEVFYLSREDELVGVRFVDDNGRFRVGKPEVLFRARRTPNPQSYAVAPDGQSFYFTGIPGERNQRPLQMTLNWRFAMPSSD